MSVYTQVSRGDLRAFLAQHRVGDLIAFEEIRDGIENTNYFVTTSTGEFVLTLFEAMSVTELPFYLDLMAYLADHDIPTPKPEADGDGALLGILCDKPAALVKRLQGRGVKDPTVKQCAEIGAQLASLHLVGQNFPQTHDNRRGAIWRATTAQALRHCLTIEERELLDEALIIDARSTGDLLPRGVIHADLFRDNALFVDDNLCGIIDLYYACSGTFIYDLAITYNDWCSIPAGQVDCARGRALLRAYREVRPISVAEISVWPAMLCSAALRFWLSRLQDLHFPKEGVMTHIKDPDEYRCIVAHRLNHEMELLDLWRDEDLIS